MREQRRKDVARLPMHEVDRPFLVGRARRRAPIPEARIHESARAGGRAELPREVSPHTQRTQAFVQEYDERRAAVGRDPFVFELLRATQDGKRCHARRPRIRIRGDLRRVHPATGPSEGERPSVGTIPAARSRSRNRWIFPVAVFGSSSRKWMSRGYLYGANSPLTSALRASASASSPVRPVFSTTYASVLVRPSASALPTTAASSTASCRISAASTSNGDT